MGVNTSLTTVQSHLFCLREVHVSPQSLTPPQSQISHHQNKENHFIVVVSREGIQFVYNTHTLLLQQCKIAS